MGLSLGPQLEAPPDRPVPHTRWAALPPRCPAAGVLSGPGKTPGVLLLTQLWGPGPCSSQGVSLCPGRAWLTQGLDTLSTHAFPLSKPPNVNPTDEAGETGPVEGAGQSLAFLEEVVRPRGACSPGRGLRLLPTTARASF